MASMQAIINLNRVVASRNHLENPGWSCGNLLMVNCGLDVQQKINLLHGNHYFTCTIGTGILI